MRPRCQVEKAWLRIARQAGRREDVVLLGEIEVGKQRARDLVEVEIPTHAAAPDQRVQGAGMFIF